MLCSICNRVPTDPVVAKTTGCLFERTLIERYIDENGRCPVTGEPLAKEDLIAVRPSTAAQTAAASGGLAATSIPGLLERMRAEWEGVMLEQFSLRQQLAQQQQEIAHALQQYEAACRVVARMAKENESLRKRHRAGDGGGGEDVDEDGDAPAQMTGVMPASLSVRIDKAEEDQQAQRKQRKGKEARVEKLSVEPQSFPVASDDSKGGATALAVLGGGAKSDNTVFAAGLVDNQLVQYDLEGRRVVATGTGHSKPIHTIAITQDASYVISASEDATVKVWKPSSASSSATVASSLVCEQTLRYAGGISALSHRTIDNQFLFSGSRTGNVYLSDLTRGEHVMISEVQDEEDNADGEGQQRTAAKRARTSSWQEKVRAVTAVELHPYAKLGAIGTDGGELFVWNVKEASVDTAIALPKGTGPRCTHVCSLDFSLDCVTLAAGFSNGHALVWDLRRIEEPLASIVPSTAAGKHAAPALVAFDAVGGSVLAVGSGNEIRVGRPAELGDNKDAGFSLPMDGKAVRGLAWGSSYLAAAGIDGVVKVFGEC